ncbi:hypothetical protein NIES4075_24750 [Tolypothrix sp. NIES-4075]|uniref:Cas10/Cmr2 second palm domain-containing protein n=1 Tax=Tolypothrix sp. NIES-4075 TaxID=2005459 RepID=UPI000B5CF173|nr:type III-B CRISPR-associated protein Cas10/Cmr2 [Tolypothrix sp. NIES-4075]GAX41502.1 hypothetical protein NIES4075_24750 [Tolypothrix sp. NIES-4075]
MTNQIYTIITFAPVQGFIEKSRKLRDLYGSSYLLSYLSWVICNAAKQYGCEVVSPASINITQGMPNQIIIDGNFPEEDAESALNKAWKCVTETCREWVEENVEDVENIKVDYKPWRRSWGLWTKYAWEFFWVQGNPNESISKVREKLNEKKRWRDWTGINWQGESSTLSGADAIAYPKLGQISDPRNYDYQQEKKDVTAFYKALSEKLGESFIDLTPGLNFSGDEKVQRSKEYGESFIDPDEELSLPELIKRLITHKAVAEKLKERFNKCFQDNKLLNEFEKLSEDLNPQRFTDLNRFKKTKLINDKQQLEQNKFFQGWFQGDGDKAGDYLKSFANKSEESDKTKEFSTEMRKWGDYFKNLPKSKAIANWRVVYAGGDDFLGVFYERKDATDCVKFFSSFKHDTWNEGKVKAEEKKITVSVGFVWASPDIPQRDVLQHCRLAEKSAKNNGRDRIAFRILFNNGNYLEWVCPWWLLEAGLLWNYCDREGKQNWTHIYNDVAVLESRHAFDDDSTDVAMGLLEIYFSKKYVDMVKNKHKQLHPEKADLTKIDSGILGEDKNYHKENSQEVDQTKVNQALNNWIINLAKVGFHLCQQ